MKLYLARHGDAMAKAVDDERPLSAIGIDEVTRMADALLVSGVTFSRVLHSGKRRAEETALTFAAKVCPGVAVGQSDGLSPMDDPAIAAKMVDVMTGDTLIAGHNPHLSRLTALLTTGDANRPLVDLTTGSVVCLSNEGGTHWQLRWMLDPALIS